jgi:hypothetical protein
MVNGNLPGGVRQEIFAQWVPVTALSARLAGCAFDVKLLIYIDFFHWHGFCTARCAVAWESWRQLDEGVDETAPSSP